jgi:FG-GAP-like repeat/Secretion system C-terminal sorting domain
MNSPTLQHRSTNHVPVAILLIPLLLLTLAFLSPALAQHPSAFMINHPLNPLKSLVLASGTESHPFFVDIDGDGDLDCFSGEYTNGSLSKVYFLRNEGDRTTAAFKLVTGTANPLDNVRTNTLSIPYFIDIDKDGDYDCFIGEGNTGAILYYKNTGSATQPLFEKQSAAFNPLSMVKFSASGVASPAFADVDGDGDYDCVVADQGGRLHYYRNAGTPTQPRFEHVTTDSDNPFAALSRSAGVYNFSFADWNKDGLVDVFINTAYYRNTGTKQRAEFTLSTAGQDAPVMQSAVAGAARYTYTPLRWVDLNGDGTPEVFQGGDKGDFVYQTLSGVKGAPVVVTAIQVSPNPSRGSFGVSLPQTGRAATIRITDVQGKVLSSQTSSSTSVKVGASLQPGAYILQVLQNNKVIFQQKIIKE